jgi:hypothetical protein
MSAIGVMVPASVLRVTSLYGLRPRFPVVGQVPGTGAVMESGAP